MYCILCVYINHYLYMQKLHSIRTLNITILIKNLYSFNPTVYKEVKTSRKIVFRIIFAISERRENF